MQPLLTPEPTLLGSSIVSDRLGETSRDHRAGKLDGDIASKVKKSEMLIVDSCSTGTIGKQNPSSPVFPLSSDSVMSRMEAGLLLLTSLGVPIHFDNVKKCVQLQVAANPLATSTHIHRHPLNSNKSTVIATPLTTSTHVNCNPLTLVTTNKPTVVPTVHHLTATSNNRQKQIATCTTQHQPVPTLPGVAKNSTQPQSALTISGHTRVQQTTHQPTVVAPSTTAQYSGGGSRLVQRSLNLTTGRFVCDMYYNYTCL